MLAVPLRMSTECLGFFVVAGPDPCFPDDLTFVQALGAQASTALYVSRTRESEAEHIRELDAVTKELREKGELLSRASCLQDGLLDLLLNGCGTATIVEHLAVEIGAAVWLLDPAGRVLHSAEGEAEPGPQPGLPDLGSYLAELRGRRDSLPVEIPSLDGAPATLVESVATDSEIFGYLLVRPSEIGDFGQLLLQGGRLVLALRLLIERSVTEAEERAGRDLIQDAILLRRGGHTSMAVATRLGYDHDGPAVVMAVRIPSRRQGPALEEARRRAEREVRDEVRAQTTGLVGLIGEEIVVVVRPEAADGCSRRILERLVTSSPTSGPGIGVSDPHSSLGDLEAAYREALTAAAVSERISHKVVRFADLGLYQLVFDAQHADRVEEYIDRWLEPLLRYDAAHHTQLLETLTCHLSGASREEVAAKLSIHPSTLKYRLRRIREIFGGDFVEAESRSSISSSPSASFR